MTSYYPENKYTGRSAFLILRHKIILTGALLAAGLLYSCDENPTNIGYDLLPGVDFVNMKSTDTIAVESFNLYADSVASSSKSNGYLGGLYDPYFGNTACDFVSQLRITGKWPGGEPVVDSVEIYIPVDGIKGATTGNGEKIVLYEINDQLYTDSVYYSNKTPSIKKLLGSYEIPSTTKDTVQGFIGRLPTELGVYLLRDTTKLNQEGGANDFRVFFKGLYVTMNNTVPSVPTSDFPPSDIKRMIIIPLTSGEFRIRVYYHTTGSAINRSYDFLINSNSVRYNRYYHDRTTAEPDKEIKHVNDGIKDSASYVQAFYGVYTKISIPGLEYVKDSLMPVSVNKARISIPVYFDNDIYTETTIPTKLYMSYKGPDGNKYLVPDYYVSSVFFDGSYNTTKKLFYFNIPSFVQQYLEGEIPLPEVEVYFAEGEYRNLILKANNSATTSRLEFTYTRY